MKNIESHNRSNKTLVDLDAETIEWWMKHKEEDERRIDAAKASKLREEKRRAALAKLTDEERELLRIDHLEA